MQVINNNELFTQVAAEESAIASGGGLLTAGAFASVAAAFGIPGLIAAPVTALFLAGALQTPQLDNL